VNTKVSIVVILIPLSYIETFSPHASKDLAAVVPLLEEYQVLTDSPGTNRILVHTFSNGGCHSLNTLVTHLNQGQQIISSNSTITPASASPSLRSLRTSAVIMDSCPGKFNIYSTIQAFSTITTNPYLKTLIIKPLLYTFFGVVSVVFRMLGTRPPIEISAGRMASTVTTVPGPRLILYSKADEMVLWSDTKYWIEMARKEEGAYLVKERLWEDAEHVGIARKYYDEYWTEVDAFLDEVDSKYVV
jgi:alpha-beta hydrolase superfamily lysophospholipase